MSEEANTFCNPTVEKYFEGGEFESFWLQLMAECQEKAPNKLPASKSLLIIGDDDAGKSQLISRLQGTREKFRKGNGLDYQFLTVHDGYCENSTKLDVWILDENPCYQRLLKYVLNRDVISDTTVILTASMAKPWNIFNSICMWINILEKHIESLNIPSTVLEEQKSKVLDRYRKYVEPTQSIYGSLEEQVSSEEIEHNLGLDIIVVITNTDYMTTLQTDFGYVDEHFDFIQLSLRKFCLSYGASLFYVSVKEDGNCDILLKYILHKVYAFPFRIPAMFLDRDSIFVPSGWDSENKILALAETLATIAFSSPFEDVIIKPSRLCDENRIETEILAQDDQDFLRFLETGLRQPLEASEPSSKDNSFSAAGFQRNSSRRVSRSPGVCSPQKKQLEAKLSSGEGDTVLQTFFKSLLIRRTSTPVDRPIGMSENRTYNPPLRSQKSSNISLDVGTLTYDASDVAIGSDENLMEEANQHKILDLCDDKPVENESLPVVHELSASFEKTISESLPEDKASDPLMESIKQHKSQYSASRGNMDKQAPLEKDEEVKNIRQLPEYFMSSQNSKFCPLDYCYQNNSSDYNDMFATNDEFVDRVKSKYNPPLRLLLEKSYENSASQIPMRNGHDVYTNKASSSVQNQNIESISASSNENKNTENSSGVVVPDLIKETLEAKEIGAEDK